MLKELFQQLSLPRVVWHGEPLGGSYFAHQKPCGLLAKGADLVLLNPLKNSTQPMI